MARMKAWLSSIGRPVIVLCAALIALIVSRAYRGHVSSASRHDERADWLEQSEGMIDDATEEAVVHREAAVKHAAAAEEIKAKAVLKAKRGSQSAQAILERLNGL